MVRVAVRLQVVVVANDALQRADDRRVVEDLADEGDAREQVVAGVAFFRKDFLVLGEDFLVEFPGRSGVTVMWPWAMNWAIWPSVSLKA